MTQSTERAADTARAGSRIEILGVEKTFVTKDGVNSALQNVDLTIESGEFVSILGPSGCGKSTLMLIVAGLVEPSVGTVRVGGGEVKKPVTDVGVVFQNDLLLEFRTALDNVALQGIIRGMSHKEARSISQDLLAHIGLGAAARRYPRQLSGGMRQRVAIARAFMHKPPLLLMDEPFGALDAISRTQMQQDLQSLWMEEEDRKTVLFITHSIEEAVRLSDRVIVMSPSPGKVVRDIRITAPRPRPFSVDDDPTLAQHSKDIYEIFGELGVFGDH
ncbi:MAG TPA: ABC transporter ATP-binding protein [Galbitalea sp.]|jgi:NitT/TauT family transport system ATP-binding protein